MMKNGVAWHKLAGVVLVTALHALVLWTLWQDRLVPSPHEAMPLFVSFIAPRSREYAEAPQRLPQLAPRSIVKSPFRQVVSAAPERTTLGDVIPPPSPIPAPEAVIEVPPMPLPADPVALDTELAVACPAHLAATYPVLSRRNGQSVRTVALQPFNFILQGT
jgi:periplasmic protein TonB